MKGFRVLGEPLFSQGLTARLGLGTRMTAGGATPDTTPPTVVITCAQSSPTATTPLNFTFTLSEVSTDFAIGDLTVGNGTASNFAGSGTSYTCDITPTVGGVVTVDIAGGTFHDAAGNGNTAATQFSITYAPTYAVVFGATTTLMIGSEGTLDDIQDNAFTAEGWFLIDTSAAGIGKVFFDKVGVGAATLGWGIGYNTTNITAQIPCVTSGALSRVLTTPHDSTWHHIAMTWNDAGDRKIDIFIDGVEVTYDAQTAGNGAIKSDAAFNAGIGTKYDGTSAFRGKIGWCRISNNVRYTGNFTPIARNTPPANDANTIRLFKMDEGTGTTINDSSTNAQDGTLTNGSWVIDP